MFALSRCQGCTVGIYKWRKHNQIRSERLRGREGDKLQKRQQRYKPGVARPRSTQPHLEAEDAVQRGQVDVLVLVEGGVLLSMHEATRVALGRLGEVGVRPEDVRVDVVSDNVLR